MYLTSITAGFSAAHYLRDYGGKCEKLHGHNWKVEVTVESAELDRAGMGIDFAELRARTAEVIGELDHSVVNEHAAFLAQNPSSELLARHLFQELARRIDDDRLRLHSVRVWESEGSWAEYRP